MVATTNFSIVEASLKLKSDSNLSQITNAPMPVGQWIIYGALGIPTLTYWAIVGIIAVRKDRTSRISHEAQTVQSEFQKGKEADDAKKEHKLTVFLIYFGIFYEFFALSAFAFYPVIPWPLPEDLLVIITYFRGQLRGMVAQIFFWVVIAVYFLSAIFLSRRTKYAKSIISSCAAPFAWIKQRRKRYAVMAAKEDTPETIDSPVDSLNESEEPLSPHSDTEIVSPDSAVSTESGAFANQVADLSLDGPKKRNCLSQRIHGIVSFLDSHLKVILVHVGFIPACTAIFRMLSCKYDPLGVKPAYLNGDASFVCFDFVANPFHLTYILIGLPIVYLIFPLALYRSLHINDEDPELRFLPRFQVYLVMFEFIQVFSTTVMIGFPQVVAPLSATALCGLAAYNWYMQPALGAGVIFNHWRTGMLMSAAWSSVVSIIVVFLNNRNDVWPLIMYLIMLAPVGMLGFWLSKWRAKKMEQNALKGLTEVHEGGDSANMLRIAETVANLALVEGYRHKLMTESSLDALQQLIGVEDMRVKIQALRAIANLSAEEVNREGILNHSIVTLIIQCLRIDDMAVIHHAARTLVHVASVKSDNRRRMVDEGVVKLLLDIIDRREQVAEHALFMTTKALLNVSTIPEMKATFFGNGTIDGGFSLVPIMIIAHDKDCDELVRKNAVGIVYNLSVLADNRDPMVYQGALEKLHGITRGKNCPASVLELAQKTLKILTAKNLDYRLRLQSITRTGKGRSRADSLVRLMAGTEATAARKGRRALAKQKKAAKKAAKVDDEGDRQIYDDVEEEEEEEQNTGRIRSIVSRVLGKKEILPGEVRESHWVREGSRSPIPDQESATAEPDIALRPLRGPVSVITADSKRTRRASMADTTRRVSDSDRRYSMATESIRRPSVPDRPDYRRPSVPDATRRPSVPDPTRRPSPDSMRRSSLALDAKSRGRTGVLRPKK